MRRSPSDFTVASCLGLMPMMLLVSVTLSFWLGTGRLHPVAVRTAPHRVQVLKPLDTPQRIDGRLEDVVGIVGSQRLRENVLHAGRLEDGPDGAARDDTRPGDRRLEEYPAGSEMPRDLTRDRRLAERNEDEILLGVLDRFADGLRHLVRFAE